MSNRSPGVAVDIADIKEYVKRIEYVLSMAFSIKPSDCLLRNYEAIAKNALNTMARLFPELGRELNAWASKFMEIQETCRKLVNTIKDPSDYVDNILLKFAIYNIDPGVFAMFVALEAMEAARVCGESDAKFFLVRTLLPSSVSFNLYRLLLDYLGMGHELLVNLFKASREASR